MSDDQPNALESLTHDWDLIEEAMLERLQQQKEFPLGVILARIQSRRDLQERSSTLMYFTGKLGSSTVRFFIDTGAEGSFVSEALVRAKQLPLQRGRSLVVRAFDGSRHECKQVLGNISLSISEYRGTHSFVVAPLSGFDVILGMDWVDQFTDVTFMPKQQQVQLSTADGMELLLYSDKAPAPSFPLCSMATYERDLRLNQVQDVFVVAVQWKTDPLSDSPILDVSIPDHFDEETRTKWKQMKKDLNLVLDDFRDLILKGYLVEMPPDREKDGGNFTIKLKPGAEPPNQPPRRLGLHLQPELEKQLKDLLARGYIQHSNSEFGAPVLFVKKKDGTWRLCVDYRELNDLTVKLKYPLPRTDDLLDSIEGATVFSSLDAVQGYHQCRVRVDDVPKTAFRTQYGHYEYLVLPFGLTNAPAHFQKYMHHIFREANLLGVTVLVYLDDILIFSKNLEEHAQHVRAVLEVLHKNKIQLAPHKCRFGLAEVEFLGHLVSANGIRPDPKKVAAIAEWTAPTNVSELKSFTGAVNFHRRHIEHCASIMAPLNKLTKKETPYIWGTEQQAAFDDLKQALISAPVLRPPKFGGMFHLYTDASGVGMGGALYQDFDDGRHPIAFWSSCYTPAQLNYGVPEQELCAVILALKYFEHYLKNAQVTVLSDHMGLSTFLTKKGIKETRRHMRWKDFLAEFDIQIKHIAGRDNVVADALSRRGWLEQLQVNTINVGGSDADNKLLDGWSAACNSDPAIKNLLEKFAAGTLSKKRFAMPDDKLYRLYGSQWCLVVPHSKVHALLHEFHDSPTAGHMGVERTEVSVRRHYWWPTLHAVVVKYITHCPHCQRNKPDNQAMYGKMVPVQVPKLPWLAVNIDSFDMPPDEAGMDYALSVTDRMSKMVHILPCMKSITGEGTARLFYDGVFKYHGMPKSIVSDRDSRFTSAFWQELMKILGTDLLMSTAMHPQTDGLAERSHRTIKETLTNWTAANPSNWSQHISSVEFAINNSKQGATGQTPFFLNHGLHPHTPASLLADSVLPASLSPHADDYLKKLKTAWKCAHQCVLAAQETMKKRADRHRRPSPFKVGDKVLVSYKVLKMPDVTARKLQHRYFGPYPVTQLCGENAVVVELSAGRTRSFNVSNLKPWKEDPDTFPGRDYSQPGPVEVIGDEEYFTIDRFIKNRWVRSGRGYKEQFLVHWENYPPEDVSWLPVQQLESEMEKDSFTELLKTLQTRKPRPAPKPKRKMNNNSQQQQATPRAQRQQQQQEPTRVRTRAQR
ncbi:hypothetical protein KSW81_000333 [Nannochloris sp. 'desiccata']|nr:hypothetical protein KSW81_000333 [Chlorella desiccata (nom. nud.)]